MIDPNVHPCGTVVDKQAVHEDFDQVRSKFRALLHDATDEELRRRSSGTRWNNRQLLFRMLLGFLIMRALLATCAASRCGTSTSTGSSSR